MDIDLLRALVDHSKWRSPSGIQVYPYYKKDQMIRLIQEDTSRTWLPNFKDKVTLAYLHHLYVVHGGVIEKQGEIWVSSHEVEGEDLEEVLVKSFLKL